LTTTDGSDTLTTRTAAGRSILVWFVEFHHSQRVTPPRTNVTCFHASRETIAESFRPFIMRLGVGIAASVPTGDGT